MTPPSGIRSFVSVGLVMGLTAGLLVTGAGCGTSSAPDGKRASDADLPLEPLPPVDLGRVEGALRTRIESLLAALEQDANPAPDSTARGRQWGELGTLFHVCELLEASEAAYRNASKLATQEASWPYYLGMIHQTRGKLQEAERDFERVLKLVPEDLAARLRLAEVQLRSSRLNEAAGSFEQVLVLDPDSAAARYGFGRLAAIRGDSQLAVSTFEAVLALQPQATEVHYPLALEYRKLGDPSQSRAHLELRGAGAVRFPDPLADRLSETKTRNAFDVVSTLAAKATELGAEDFFGFAIEQVGAVDGAADQLRRQIDNGLAGTPEETQVRWRARMHYAIGGLEARSGRDAAAAEQFQAALALDPALVDAGRRLGNALARSGRLQEAVEAYSSVLDEVALDREARLRRATALLELSRLEEAARDLETLIAADPQDGMALLRLGSMRARTGDLSRARAAFEGALAADLSAVERSLAHRQLARLATGSNDPDALGESLPHLRAVVALEPERIESRLDLAGALARLERFDESLDQYDRALALEPDRPDAELDRVRVLIRLGRDAEARQRLEDAASSWPGRPESTLLLSRLLASSANDSVRDGNRAVALAGALFKAEQSLAHAEVLAMALAEAGHFEEAVALQSQILSGTSGLPEKHRERLSVALTSYRNGLPLRLP